MKIDALSAGIWLLVIFFGYISIHPFIAVIVGSWTGDFASIKIWKDIVVGVVAVAVISYGLMKESIRKKILEDRLLWLTALYTLLTFVVFVVSQSYEHKYGFAGLIFNLRFIALFSIVRILMYGTAKSKETTKRVRNVLSKWVVIIATFIALFGITQVVILPSNFMEKFGYNGVTTINPVSTVDDNANVRRAFSTLNDANEFGAYLIIPIALAVERLLRTRKWQYLMSILVMVVGVYLSHSRAALLGVIAMSVIFCIVYSRNKLNRRMVAIGISGVVSVSAVVLLATAVSPSVRLVVFHSSSKDGGLVQGSTFDHYVATKAGIKDAIDHPFGRGVGQAGPASFYNKNNEKPRIAENYYVQIAQEVGIAGLILFIASIIVAMYQVLSTKNIAYSTSFFAGFVGVSIVAVFLHTWASDSVSYIAWGLLGIFLPINPLMVNRKKSNGSARA